MSIKNIPPRTLEQLKIGGLVTSVKRITTKNGGKLMLFANVEDLTGRIEVVVFPGVYDKYPDVFKENSIVVVKGKVNARDGTMKFLCDDVKTIAPMVATPAAIVV